MEKNTRTRFARLTSWSSGVVGLIGFLDQVRIWELGGDIPKHFYTFPMMLRIFSLALSFSLTVAIVGNIFDLLKPYLGVHLTPLWYGLIFAFIYIRYFGSFGEFGIQIYRTVISTTVITLFLTDNALRFALARLGAFLSESSHPLLQSIASYLPGFGFYYYHLFYLVTLSLPKRQGEHSTEPKPLYSNKVVEISEEVYDALVESPSLHTPTSSGESEGRETAPPPSPSPATSSPEQGEEKDYSELTKLVNERLSGELKEDVFIWGKHVYVRSDLVSSNGLPRVKVKATQGGEPLFEGEYVKVLAGEVLAKDKRKEVMKEAMKRASSGIKIEEV